MSTSSRKTTCCVFVLRNRRGGRGLDFMSLCRLPQALPADEGMGIVAKTNAFRELCKLHGIASAKHDVIGYQGGLQTSHDIVNRSPPLRFAVSLKPAKPDLVLKGPAVLVRQMS